MAKPKEEFGIVLKTWIDKRDRIKYLYVLPDGEENLRKKRKICVFDVIRAMSWSGDVRSRHDPTYRFYKGKGKP